MGRPSIIKINNVYTCYFLGECEYLVYERYCPPLVHSPLSG